MDNRPIDRLARWRVSVGFAVAVLTLVGAEWASSWLIKASSSIASSGPSFNRAAAVVQLSKDPADLPEPGRPLVLMIGNSHTYALPGLRRGDSLRAQGGAVTIDGVAELASRRRPRLDARFALLSYPNFLPFEMLTRVAHLLHHDIVPDVVLLGLTFRNIARDSQTRSQIHSVFRDGNFTSAFDRMLADPRVRASDVVHVAIGTERRKAELEAQAARLRSDADRVDERLTALIDDRVTLSGRSADLRAVLYRAIATRIQDSWSVRQTAYEYALVDADYRFNLRCLEALLLLLRQHGAAVMCYYAPERTDQPPLLDPHRQGEFRSYFDRWAAERGIAVVDAGSVVPNEYWGWERGLPDRSHFTEPGHVRLAEFLVEALEQRHLWAAVESK